MGLHEHDVEQHPEHFEVWIEKIGMEDKKGAKMKDLVEIEYEDIKTLSHKATLFVINTVEVWIPLSFIDNIDKKEYLITIPKWFAIQEGLIEG